MSIQKKVLKTLEDLGQLRLDAAPGKRSEAQMVRASRAAGRLNLYIGDEVASALTQGMPDSPSARRVQLQLRGDRILDITVGDTGPFGLNAAPSGKILRPYRRATISESPRSTMETNSALRRLPAAFLLCELDVLTVIPGLLTVQLPEKLPVVEVGTRSRRRTRRPSAKAAEPAAPAPLRERLASCLSELNGILRELRNGPDDLEGVYRFWMADTAPDPKEERIHPSRIFVRIEEELG